ncbi:hypothetical protein [Pseudaeromonas paramecii]|uniref:PH domain-containing protein n=1 Tax=Pseudaeromonas paramecii TaxID=2138166 RepID=A0ABP8PXE8_9GAMM
MPPYPRLNKIYAGFILGAGLTAAAVAGYSALFNAEDEQTAWLVGGMAGLILLGACLLVRSAARLRLTAEGVSRGNRTLRWDAITGVALIGAGIQLTDGRHKLTLAPWAYQEPEAVRAFIQAHLPRPQR